MLASTHHFRILSLARGTYLPERYETRIAADHARRTRFGAARQGAYQVVKFANVVPVYEHDIVPVIDGIELFGGPDV